MPQKFSRRSWLKNASLLTTLGSSALGGQLLANSLTQLEGQPQPDNAEQYIRLFYNENPYGPPASALGKVMEIANRGNRYATFATYDFDSLREKIAAEEGLTKDHVLLGHGSFQPIIWLAQHFMKSGGEIVVPSPTFDIVGMYARKLKATTVAVEVNDQMEASLKTSAALVLPPSMK